IDIAANGYDSVIPTMLQNLSPAMIALVVILVLSASMSTLSSLVIASSSTLTIDFIKGAIRKDMDDKSQVLMIRIFIVVFIAISAIIALIQYKSSVTFIAQLMGISWGALAGAFLAPFLYALYWKKTTKLSCWVCFIWGAGIMIIDMVAKPMLPAIMRSPINCGAIAMLAGLVIVPVVSWITPKPESKLVDECFACYEKKTSVPQREALGD
ncbi:MAG: sodium:solute symporter, partial [Eubacteriales bacterium]|nr:sodium:solute symporter [Eubacteriales bacterium]